MIHGRQDFTDSGRGATKVDDNSVGKVRVYQVAKDLGLPNRDLVAKIQSLGIDIRNHMSSLDLEDVQRVKRALEKERQESLVEQRLTSTVIRRRSKASEARKQHAVDKSAAPAEQAAAPIEPASAPAQVQAEVTVTPPAPPQDEALESGRQAVAADDAREQQLAAAGSASPATGEATAAAITAPPAAEQETRTAPTQEQAAAPVPEPASLTTAKAQPEAEEQKVETPATPAPAAQPAAKPATPPVVHRYAPGFKPGMQYGPKSRATSAPPRSQAAPPPQTDSAGEAISAADALKMMASAQRPRVVITDLDGRRPGQRREVVAGKDLFGDRRFKGGGKRKKKIATNKKTRKTEITTPAQHKRVIRLQDAIGVAEMAHQMGVKSTEMLKKLWAMGMKNVTINHALDPETASLLATEFGYEVEDRSFSEEAVLNKVEDRPEDLQTRAPVVTVMGHVDHGKTSLLDAIRHTSVASGEAGGITQHIGAYRVPTDFGNLVFLDTPGHEAFTQMRARGAQCTDVVVLVVAADDGPMPQTFEAIDHAKDAGVPIIVAVNKVDRPDANPDRTRTMLSERGLIPEEWGGETIYVDVSAKTGQGLDTLLESLSVQSEILELKANPNKPAKGTVVEARLDKARGVVCTLLVQEGTLRVGDTVVAGEYLGKVRAIIDDRGNMVKEAGPCSPVEILGMSGVPEAGEILNAVADEKAARVLAEYRRNEHRQRELAGTSASKSLEEMIGRIKSGEVLEVKLLIKSDVHGSAEAVREALVKLGTEKVSVNVISSAVGGINETDINLAKAAGALVVGFNVRPAGKSSLLAEREGVEIRIYDIIYELLDDVKSLMQGLLPKERREKFLGRAEVRDTFTIPKIGMVAGCGVQEGKITRHALARLVRDNIKIYDGRIGSLRRFKDDVKEVVQGYECGLTIDGYGDIKVGDVIEAYEIEEVAAALQ